MRPYQSPDMIAENPAYGHVVCFCERVSSSEVVAATRATIRHDPRWRTTADTGAPRALPGL